MPQHLKGGARMCSFLETLVVKAGALLVYDGSKNENAPKWLPEPTFFTRVYRLRMDGELINTRVKFTYDLRDTFGALSDVTITYKDIETYERKLAEQRAKEQADRLLASGIAAPLNESIAKEAQANGAKKPVKEVG